MMNNMYTLIGLVLAILVIVVPMVICAREETPETDEEVVKKGSIALLYMIGTLIAMMVLMMFVF